MQATPPRISRSSVLRHATCNSPSEVTRNSTRLSAPPLPSEVSYRTSTARYCSRSSRRRRAAWPSLARRRSLLVLEAPWLAVAKPPAYQVEHEYASRVADATNRKSVERAATFAQFLWCTVLFRRRQRLLKSRNGSTRMLAFFRQACEGTVLKVMSILFLSSSFRGM